MQINFWASAPRFMQRWQLVLARRPSDWLSLPLQPRPLWQAWNWPGSPAVGLGPGAGRRFLWVADADGDRLPWTLM